MEQHYLQEELLSRLLEIVSFNHPEHKSAHSDSSFALSKVLTASKVAVKSVTIKDNSLDLFQTKEHKKLKLKIGIDGLNNGLILKLHTRVDGLFWIATPGACKDIQHVHCHISCEHSSSSCKRCINNGGQPSPKCDHKCKQCNQKKEKCTSDTMVCCSNCSVCIMCNKRVIDVYVLQMFAFAVPTEESCEFSMFLFCLGELPAFRNMLAHTTVSTFKRFYFKQNHLKGFKQIQNKKQLVKYIGDSSMFVPEYVKNNFTKNSLTDSKYLQLQQKFTTVVNKPIGR